MQKLSGDVLLMRHRTGKLQGVASVLEYVKIFGH